MLNTNNNTNNFIIIIIIMYDIVTSIEPNSSETIWLANLKIYDNVQFNNN